MQMAGFVNQRPGQVPLTGSDGRNAHKTQFVADGMATAGAIQNSPQYNAFLAQAGLGGQGGQQMGGTDPAAALKQIESLYKQGLLTQDEYEVKRSEILSRI